MGASRHGAALAFVFDRQVLGALAPTILKDTGLDAGQFAVVNSYFFVAYTVANPLWGTILDYVGLRVGMLMGVAIWTIASVSHGWMTGLMGFALCRALLGFGEGVTFPGGLRTAVVSLPASKRARAIALSFSGGTLGGVAAPFIAVPIGLRYGWRAAFMFTGALGFGWMALWFAIARPPFLPKVEQKARRLAWANPLERRFWAIVFSYALPAIAPGPILTFSQCISIRALASWGDLVAAVDAPARLGRRLFLLGLGDDRCVDNRRPVGMFLLLTACSLVAVSPPTTSVLLVAIISWRRSLRRFRYWRSKSATGIRASSGDDDGHRVGIVGAGDYLRFLGPLFNGISTRRRWSSRCAHRRDCGVAVLSRSAPKLST